VPGFAEAVLSVPNGAVSARPVIVVLHGSGDRPDYNCDAWRHITGARGFVLCPRGQVDPRESTPGDTRYTLRGDRQLRVHLDAALDRLTARFGAYVDLNKPLVAGFSLGASEIARLALDRPAEFSRVALVEGGWAVWTEKAIRSYTAGGGQRVLFACGSAWCVPQAKAAVMRFVKAGASAQFVYAPVGHTTDRPLQEAIMSQMAWFEEGDPRWGAKAP
jgi:predicted esterase